MQTLQTYVGNLATKLIDANAKSGWTFSNETGFSALFAGDRRGSNGNFVGLWNNTYFWSSTVNGSSGAYYMYLSYYGCDVYVSYSFKDYGFSVRCLKN